VLIALAIITTVIKTREAKAQPVVVDIRTESIEKQVEYFTNLYGGDIAVNLKVIECESNGIVTTIGDSGRSYGLAQFQKPTFNWMAKEFGEELDYKSPYDQIKLMTWAISKGYGSNWTTYVAIKHGGTYKFYSSQLKKHFIVKCKL